MEEFSGSLKSGPVHLTVIPWRGVDAARILVSIPLETDDVTLSLIKARAGMAYNAGPNLSNTVAAAAMYYSIEDALNKTLVKGTKTVGYQSSDCYSTGSHFNVVVDVKGQLGKAFSTIRYLLQAMVVPPSLWRTLFGRIMGPDGKPIRANKDDYEASCGAIKRGMGNIRIVCSGKVMVKNTNKASAKDRIKEKLEHAVRHIREMNTSNRAPSKYPFSELPKEDSRALKNALDYYFCDFYKSKITIHDGRAWWSRSLPQGNPEHYAENTVARMGHFLSEASAFYASGMMGFTAQIVSEFEGKKVTKSEILKSLKA